MTHLLSLSHAGTFPERAVKHATAIEASLKAQAAGLKVWVDKWPDGKLQFRPATSWQDQREAAIVNGSTSFGLLGTCEDACTLAALKLV